MNNIEELKQRGLVEAFSLKSEEEIFEAEFNLLGFFETLHSIDKRLEKEKGKEDGDD
jgi:hypothetical protein